MTKPSLFVKPAALEIKIPLAERATKADAQLAARYDNLSLKYLEVEKQLKDLKPPHPVWIEYGIQECEHTCLSEWEELGLTKWEGKWRLCHTFSDDRNPDEPNRQISALADRPVDVRVRAASEVHKLVQAIVKAKEEYVPQVDAAIAELNALTFYDL